MLITEMHSYVRASNVLVCANPRDGEGGPIVCPFSRTKVHENEKNDWGWGGGGGHL